MFSNTTFYSIPASLNTRIEINKDLCTNSINKDPLEIAGMFLHEFVHARIYEHLYHLGFNSNLRNYGLDKAWNDFVQLNFPFVQPVGNDQHKLMAQVFVNDIAMALWELNGKYGN